MSDRLTAEEQMKKIALVIYAVYKNPKDYPGKFVVRKWCGMKPDFEPLIVADTLEEARSAFVTEHLWNLGRYDNDDPAILETWI